ncbi:ATP-binding protein [Niabella hirudinis]|uniref:ATP-binding protein n=1 Tax=Niabella hirudinis TaxID=1285929 RepID=UPI003EC0F194
MDNRIIPRFATSGMLKALTVSPVVFINGARQVGKSTLVRSNLDKIGIKGTPATYLSFDNPTQMAAAAANPDHFLTSHKSHLVIDEVQMVPEVFRALKFAVDELRINNKSQANGRFLLTGSANILALPKLADSLVGRMSVLTLYPYCTAEATKGKGDGLERILKKDFANITDRGLTITDAIRSGSFPELRNRNSAERNIWFEGYISTMLQRDVRLIADLEKISVLPHLLRVLATRSASLINDSDIAREIGLNMVTTKFYRNIFKMMFLNFDIEPWHRNVGKRLVKSSKGFLIDSQMLCYMLDWDIDDLATNRPELFGRVLENYVATELLKLISFSGKIVKLLHFRTSDGKEVDFVLERPDGEVVAIEVKKTASVDADDFKGIKVLADLTKKQFSAGIVLYGGKDVVAFGKNLWAVPYPVLWQ